MSANTIRCGSWNIGRSLSTKLHHILAEAIQLDLHILALQEIGEAVSYQQQVSAAGYHMYICTHQYAGVAILVQKSMCPLIREVHRREQDGRLVAIELQMGKEIVVVMSAYMHSGIDFTSDSDSMMSEAQLVYDNIKKWSVRGSRVIVMGDMNETMSDMDREYNSSIIRHGRLISQLSALGLTDVYRLLHPTTSGYTHFTTTASRESKSRLDYIFTRGWSAAAIHYCHISTTHTISHHRLIHTQLQVQSSVKVKGKRVKVQVPNLRHASAEQKEELVAAVEEEWNKSQCWVRGKAAGSRMEIEELTRYLSTTVYSAARDALGMSGQRKWRHKSVDKLEKQRQSLTSLLHLTEQLRSSGSTNMTFTTSREWRTKYDKCNRMLQTTHLTHPAVHYQQFVTDCKQAICNIRKQSKLAKLKLSTKSATTADSFHSNTTATVHRMMKHDSPTELTSVVDAAGQLITDPTQMKQVLHNGFASVFDLPPPTTAADVVDQKMTSPYEMVTAATTTPIGAPGWYEVVYQRRRDTIQAEWYDTLMDAVSESEVRDVCSSCPYYAAPGHDGVSAGVWRVLAERSDVVCQVLALWMSACIRLHMMPSLGKLSIIVPIPKKRNQQTDMSNIRPISLQAALTKLVSKLLATRLANILASHPILHPAQEAFIKNGAISNCIDSWLDIWEMSKSKKSDCFNLFYDIKAAYDSVQHMDLLRSLHRLRLPVAFMTLIADSLCDLTSCVRTIYGLTDEFAVRRSVRQGDPLAPLLYVIFMDALHVGMECNPLPQYYGMRDGIAIGKDVVASKGFADDTVAMSSTLAGLYRINKWVHAWIAFNHSQLHPTKTQLVGRHRSRCMTNTMNLAVSDTIMIPVTLETAISYLGVKVSMNLDWSESVKKMKSLIGMFTSRILAYKLTLEQAVIVINMYLIPKLDLLLRYINVSCKTIDEFDMMITRCIVICSRVSRAIRGIALSALTGLILPSQHETLSKVSECFIRLNNNTLSSRTGRIRWAEASSYSNVSQSIQSLSITNRLVRVKWLAEKVNWKLHVLPTRSNWYQHDLVPSGVRVQLTHFSRLKQPVVFDYVGEWGRKMSCGNVVVYTDGSSSSASSEGQQSSSWGICFANDWFVENYSRLPSQEKSIKVNQHLQQACIAGGKIDTTVSSGVFMAELQAIYRALQAVPVTCNLTIISDSQAALKAIHSYENAVSNRKRMRMVGRPILSLIAKLQSSHAVSGSTVSLKHIAAHSNTSHRSQHQVGNSCADRVASHHRLNTNVSGSSFNQLKLHLGEEWMYAKQGDTLISADIRSTLRSHLRVCAFDLWYSMSKHNVFACVEVQDLCLQLVRSGKRERVRCVLALLTDSLQYHSARVDGTDGFGEYECNACDADADVVADVRHVMTCTSRTAARVLLCTAVRNELCSLPAVCDWIDANVAVGVNLQQLLSAVFDVACDVNDGSCLRIMIGAFSDKEASKVMSKMGQVKREIWLSVMSNVRLMLFEYVYSIWRELRSK